MDFLPAREWEKKHLRGGMRDEEEPAKATVEKGSSRPKERHWQWLGRKGLACSRAQKSSGVWSWELGNKERL